MELTVRTLGTMLLILLLLTPVNAVVRRHDVDASEYVALGADEKYESAALLNLGTTCAVAGGVIIHPEWALTAAHCTPAGVNGQTVRVNFGPDQNNLTQTFDADDWFRHSSYNNNVTTGFDFGLVHLTEPVLDVTPMRMYRQVGEMGQTATVVGYGRTGTGLTGDNMPRGTRYGGEFNIDNFGTAVGFSPKIVLSDFDNPDNPGDSTLGPNIALPLESAVGNNDSGSPWFIEISGLVYAAAITSFRSSTDGSTNSSYRDISGATRISREITWIDNNHDVTVFWDGADGDWAANIRWVAHNQPTSVNAAVIDRGTATITAAGEEAKYVFVDGTGTLQVGNSLDTQHIRVKRGGTLSPLGSAALTTEVVMTSGNLEFEFGTDDQFIITGPVTIDGTLALERGSYADPSTRGNAEELTLLVANDLSGAFDTIEYEGDTIGLGDNYVGLSSNGDDGLFINVSVDENNSNEIVVANYLALPGDANGDMIVDGLDFIIWNDHKFTAGNDWGTGDFNGDGLTDGLDFILWNDFKFTSANVASRRVVNTPLSVPEPGGLVLGTGLLLLVSQLRLGRFRLR